MSIQSGRTIMPQFSREPFTDEMSGISRVQIGLVRRCSVQPARRTFKLLWYRSFSIEVPYVDCGPRNLTLETNESSEGEVSPI